jgi:hypothetical protein
MPRNQIQYCISRFYFYILDFTFMILHSFRSPGPAPVSQMGSEVTPARLLSFY